VRQERRQRCGVIAAATPLKKRGAMIGAHDLFIATYADGIELAIGADDATQICWRARAASPVTPTNGPPESKD